MPTGRSSRNLAYAGLKRFRPGWLALLAATIIALYLCWLMLRPFVEVLLWAMVLVIVFYPFHQALLRRSNRPGTSAIISCMMVVGVILLPLSLLMVVIVDEAGEAAKNLSNNWNALLDPESKRIQWISQFIKVDRFRSREGIQEGILEALGAFGFELASNTASVLTTVLITLLKTVFVVFTMYYLFRDGERVQETLRATLPLDRVQSAKLFSRTREVINASVYGVMVIAIIQGFMGGLAFWVLGLPSPLLWGSVMTLLSMIPLVGSTVVWIPTAAWLAIDGQFIKATLLAMWGGLAIAAVDNFLRPRLVGGKTRLHELLVFFSVVGGLAAFGMLGIVIGPVIVAITLALLDVFRQADRPAMVSQPTLAQMQSNLRDLPPEGDRVPTAPASPPAPSDPEPDAPTGEPRPSAV